MPGKASNKAKRVRKTGDVEDLKRKVWQAITTAEGLFMDLEVDAPTRLRAVTAMTQASMMYARLLEMTAQAAEIERLEAMIEEEARIHGDRPALPPHTEEGEDDLGDDEVWQVRRAAIDGGEDEQDPARTNGPAGAKGPSEAEEPSEAEGPAGK